MTREYFSAACSTKGGIQEESSCNQRGILAGYYEDCILRNDKGSADVTDHCFPTVVQSCSLFVCAGHEWPFVLQVDATCILTHF